MSIVNPRLPVPLCLLIQARLASTASSRTQRSPFPFPKHSNPTPHEIFHLPRGASQGDIKSRYYELVRIYHPDCSTMPSSTSHSHFQAISDAYAILSGKKTSRISWPSDLGYEEEILRRRRAQWRASASSDEFGHGGYGANTSEWEQEDREKWNFRLLILVAIFTVLPLSVLSPLASINFDRKHEEAKKNLANARREAREVAFSTWAGKRKENQDTRNKDRHSKSDVDNASQLDGNITR